jgi:hypothetical protein
MGSGKRRRCEKKPSAFGSQLLAEKIFVEPRTPSSRGRRCGSHKGDVLQAERTKASAAPRCVLFNCEILWTP